MEEFIRQLKLKRYSLHTIKAYRNHLQHFLQFHLPKHPADLSKHEIESYLLQLMDGKNVSSSYQNQVINAIKFYYAQVLACCSGSAIKDELVLYFCFVLNFYQAHLSFA